MLRPEPPRPGEPERYLFIIGAARSGTKLVRDLLAKHPEAAAVPYDVNYVWRLGNERFPDDELTPELLTDAIRARIARQLNRFRRGRPLLVEKTVSNGLRVAYVRAAFPGARFVQLVRDPVDIVESAYREWQAPPKWRYVLRKAMTFPLAEAFGYARVYAAHLIAARLGRRRARTWGPRYRGIDDDLARADLLEVCAIQARRCMELADQGLAAVPAEQVFRLSFEDFVRHPAERLRAMWEFAELSPDAVDLQAVCNRVTDRPIGRGWRALDERQRAVVLRHGPTFRRTRGTDG